MGHIIYFYLESFCQAMEYSHNNGIKEIYLDANGTKMCFIDSKSDVYLYDPTSDFITHVSDCPDNIEGIIWNQNIMERSLFGIFNKSVFVTYMLADFCIEGNVFFFFFVKSVYYNKINFTSVIYLYVDVTVR